MASNRIGRINEEIQRELASPAAHGEGPPGTRPGVHHPCGEFTPDLRYAKVYVSVLDQSDVKEVIRGLKSAGGYLRRGAGPGPLPAVHPGAGLPGRRLH